jgi:NifU-like N terminal domain.
MLSERLVGMTLEELEDLETDDITDMLGVTISPMRIPCAVLGNQVAKDGAKLYQGELDPEDYGQTVTEE